MDVVEKEILECYDFYDDINRPISEVIKTIAEACDCSEELVCQCLQKHQPDENK